MSDTNKNKFPDNFFWGTATSSYQVEGGIHNNDWAHAAMRKQVPPAGDACEHYTRYDDDFKIAQSLGQNAHRLSIEWARIEPEEGKFNEEAIHYYRDVLKSLKAKGLVPFVTLWHFTLPEWFERKGGFLNQQAIYYFSRYCLYVVEHLRDDADYWMTMNEPMVFAKKGYIDGEWPPFKVAPFRFWKVISMLIISHNTAYREIKKLDPNLKIGFAHSTIHFKSNTRFYNRMIQSAVNWFWNVRFVDFIHFHLDFIGINYYSHRKFGEERIHEKSDMGWDIYPEGMYFILKEVAKYKKPIFVTENGIADREDKKRARFIKEHLAQVLRAIEEGVPVKGYFHWSLLDNYEWSFGYQGKFGLVEVDFKTQERKIRSSAYEYKRICEGNKLID